MRLYEGIEVIREVIVCFLFCESDVRKQKSGGEGLRIEVEKLLFVGPIDS